MDTEEIIFELQDCGPKLPSCIGCATIYCKVDLAILKLGYICVPLTLVSIFHRIFEPIFSLSVQVSPFSTLAPALVTCPPWLDSS